MIDCKWRFKGKVYVWLSLLKLMQVLEWLLCKFPVTLLYAMAFYILRNARGGALDIPIRICRMLSRWVTLKDNTNFWLKAYSTEQLLIVSKHFEKHFTSSSESMNLWELAQKVRFFSFLSWMEGRRCIGVGGVWGGLILRRFVQMDPRFFSS